MSSHLGRYEQVGEVLARHGLGFLAEITGVDRWFAPRPADHDPATTPVRVRLALEDLGPTFIKLGQLLSTRSDLLPPPYLTELAKLQDAAPAVPPEEILTAIRAELGADVEELFADFDVHPLASASIGQAHAAHLDDGTPVVVKVRRPGVVAQVEEDLAIVQILARQASRRWERARDYDLEGLAQDFAISLRSELDYLQEGRNAERFATNFEADPMVRIPRIVWERTTSRVLTLERMTGIKVNDIERLDAAGIDRKEVARRGADMVLKMIFHDGFFHADPHPGNLFVTSDGSIALIDFGMVGELNDELKQELADFLIGYTQASPSLLASALYALSITKEVEDRPRLERSLAGWVSQYAGRPLSEVNFTHLISQLLAMLREHHLQLPRQMALLFKVLIMVEGMGLQLNHEFALGEVLTPYARRLVENRISVLATTKRLLRASGDAAELFIELPRRLRRIVETLDSSGIQIHLRAAELEPLVGRAERIGNRLVAGMITAALINGVGELVAGKRTGRPWMTLLMTAGLSTIASLIGYLMWTGRRHD
ncbi:ABC1 kinase family protein [Leifsonia sp. LS-T14]|uniref:ABC1 kinase family protein n=1 Tax=unclassified Leifsonia TaxID=2663824 RepID=UPI0035A5E213